MLHLQTHRSLPTSFKSFLLRIPNVLKYGNKTSHILFLITFSSCSSLFSCCWVKIITKIKLDKKGQFDISFYTTVHHSGKSGLGLRADTSKQKLKQKPWRNTAYLFALYSLLTFLSYATQDHKPKSGSVHSGLGPLTSTGNQENVA